MERQQSLAPPLKLWCVVASSGLSYVAQHRDQGTIYRHHCSGQNGGQFKKPESGVELAQTGVHYHEPLLAATLERFGHK
jgi:hypothetical protein